MSQKASKIKHDNIKPTEIAVPKDIYPQFCKGLGDYCNLEDAEVKDLPKREGTQNYMDDSGGIDEWYVDLANVKCNGHNLNFDDLVWIGRFWRSEEK